MSDAVMSYRYDMMNRDEKREYNRLYQIANKVRIAANRAARRAGLGEKVRRCSIDGCDGIYDTNGLCGRHYAALRRNGDPTEVRQIQHHGKTLEERMALHTHRTEGCWEWTSARNKAGYGVLRIGDGNKLAHRIAWKQENGAIPTGKYVLHRCDNPACVRPEHLFLGTLAENNTDKIFKNRHRTKLTDADIKEIRAASGSHTEVGLAYGVSRVLIANIRSGKAWKQVP